MAEESENRQSTESGSNQLVVILLLGLALIAAGFLFAKFTFPQQVVYAVAPNAVSATTQFAGTGSQVNQASQPSSSGNSNSAANSLANLPNMVGGC